MYNHWTVDRVAENFWDRLENLFCENGYRLGDVIFLMK